ncbi:hypothetical protein C8A03DRAFT_17973 [Achaetomium macrosporum]|uniref:Uncharacterized protein n=1 Tax=Achaetomium macrosporum TaxID=79813 RepID=A0AAN7C594_9PEZI|nr:hypothetical protein C8A03DRAFT_17973 [Achaetomium macrosporum]
MASRKAALATAGSAAARLLALELGMSVTVNYSRDAARAEALVKELRDTWESRRFDETGLHPPSFHAIQADLSQQTEVIRLADEAAAASGNRLDVIISNVGWTRMRNFSDLDDGVNEEDWDRCFSVNVKSQLWLFHAGRKWLEERNSREEGAAAFVSTASIACSKPSGSSLPYAVTKAARIHLVKSLAVIAAPAIRVNCISPGVLLADWELSFAPERLEAVKEQNRLKRFAAVDDVAQQVKVSVTSRTVTGQNAIIDAGLSL